MCLIALSGSFPCGNVHSATDVPIRAIACMYVYTCMKLLHVRACYSDVKHTPTCTCNLHTYTLRFERANVCFDVVHVSITYKDTSYVQAE